MPPTYAIMRFAKYKGPEISRIEAHDERTKETYASNPDVDKSRSQYNIHLVEPTGKYRAMAEKRIAEVGCRTRSDSVRLVETLVTASPHFFKGKSDKEIRAFFERAMQFFEERISAELDAALRKFFPALGKFLTETKKYDKAIRTLKADNEELQAELKDAKAESYHKLLADAQLRADYENLQRAMDKIPPEIVFMYAGRNRNPDKTRDLER